MLTPFVTDDGWAVAINDHSAVKRVILANVQQDIDTLYWDDPTQPVTGCGPEDIGAAGEGEKLVVGVNGDHQIIADHRLAEGVAEGLDNNVEGVSDRIDTSGRLDQ